jgi:hypothetical protein
LQRLRFAGCLRSGYRLTHWRGCAGRWMLRTVTVRLRSLPCCGNSSRRREALASLEMQLPPCQRNRHSTRRVCQNSPEHLPSETHKPITGYLWARRQRSPVPPSADSRHCCGSALKTESMVTPVFNTDFDDKLACLNLSGV